jgi:hypothetical protein
MCFPRENHPSTTNSQAGQEKGGLAKRLVIVQETPVRHEFIILADSPGALVEVCGISLLERNLRTLQRLGVTKVVVLSATPDVIGSHLAGWSRHRATVEVDLRARTIGRRSYRKREIRCLTTPGSSLLSVGTACSIPPAPTAR